jgi:hypothetical protein
MRVDVSPTGNSIPFGYRLGIQQRFEDQGALMPEMFVRLWAGNDGDTVGFTTYIELGPPAGINRAILVFTPDAIGTRMRIRVGEWTDFPR